MKNAFHFLLSAMFVLTASGILFYSTASNAAEGEAAKSAPDSVELFQAVKDGKIEAKIIFKNRKSATVCVENKTDKPLTVVMPEVAGAAPILAQAPFGNANADNSEGGLQGMMENMNGNFLVPPEKIIRREVPALCLDHGKKDPNPKSEYVLKPIEDLTDRPAVIELGKALGQKNAPKHEILQLAVWMLNNDLTAADLAKDSWKTADRGSRPVNSPADLKAAQNLAQSVFQKTQNAYQPPVTGAP